MYRQGVAQLRRSAGAALAHSQHQPCGRTSVSLCSTTSSGGSGTNNDHASDGQRHGYSFGTVLAAGGVGIVGGVLATEKDARLRSRVLPSNSFRACCDVALTEAQKVLSTELDGIVGSKYVRRNYTQKGSRLGQGTALAHVSPGTMKEAVQVLKACVAADVAVLPQGANTSLTGGSVARAECDRPFVVINLRRLSKMLPIGDDAKQVLCFSGAGIYDLKDMLEKKHKRDSHSILGSIFLNPSIGAGVAFGSGGTQIRKGPSWTERALFCRVREDGEVEIVNTLGLNDGGDPLGFLDGLDGKESLSNGDVDPNCKAAASWPRYSETVRKLDGEVSRYNADTTGIDCCRSEGKVMVLASVHDTFPMPEKSQLIWISCKDYETTNRLKREVMLRSGDTMAKSCEYMNREVYNGVDRAGRILVKMIELVGMQRLEPLWNLKLTIEMIPLPFTDIICDKFLYWFNNIIPQPLPQVLRDLGRDYDHHMLVEFSEYSAGEVERLQTALDKFASTFPDGHIKYHVCADAYEKSRATLWRFVVAPAFRTYCIGVGMQGLSIDYALPKNCSNHPTLPEKKYPVQNRWIYSHFGCNVFHEDLIFGPEVDVEHAKHEIKRAVEEGTGGKLPAEHGHGTEYKASKAMQERWKKMDPLNVMNPGVGGTSPFKHYKETAVHMGCTHAESAGNMGCSHAH